MYVLMHAMLKLSMPFYHRRSTVTIPVAYDAAPVHRLLCVRWAFRGVLISSTVLQQRAALGRPGGKYLKLQTATTLFMIEDNSLPQQKIREL